MRQVLTRCGVLAGVSALTLGVAPGVLAAVGDTGEAGGTIVEEYGDGTYLEAAGSNAGQTNYTGAGLMAADYGDNTAYDDWRVPSAEEMAKVVEAHKAGHLAVALENDNYWTTTKDPLNIHPDYRQVCMVGTPTDCTSPNSWSLLHPTVDAYVRFVRIGQTLIVVSTAPAASASSAAPQLMNVELIHDESTVLQGALPYGTWLPVLTSVDTENLTGRSTPDGHDLLGWSTDKNFPVDIAQRQVDNNWGAYETHDDDGRITSVFIPVGHHANITSDTQLHAIWSTPTTTDAAPTAVNSQVTD